MANIKIHEQLTLLRKQRKLTQEEFARVLGVTNQSVSKWESGACCPDISLLPDIANFFGVSIDILFGKISVPENQTISVECIPWENDDTVRAVVFLGKKIISNLDDLSRFTFVLDGEAKNIECRCNLTCGNIQGNANAGCDIRCGDVTRSNGALGIGGQAIAGCDIYCGNISGGASAGCDVNCGSIDGTISTAGQINCTNVNGNIVYGGTINCSIIKGNVTCSENVACEQIHGDVDCKGNITYSN